MSALTGWHPCLVFCNRRLIASFMTERLRDGFINERQKRYPHNEYAAA